MGHAEDATTSSGEGHREIFEEPSAPIPEVPSGLRDMRRKLAELESELARLELLEELADE